jgi:hypothetical protein
VKINGWQTLQVAAMLLLGTGCTMPSRQTRGSPGSSVLSTDNASGALTDPNIDPDNTIVCETEHGVGSNIPERVCRTVRSIRKEQTVGH